MTSHRTFMQTARCYPRSTAYLVVMVTLIFILVITDLLS
jgi:hypothetical protein